MGGIPNVPNMPSFNPRPRAMVNSIAVPNAGGPLVPHVPNFNTGRSGADFAQPGFNLTPGASPMDYRLSGKPNMSC